MDKQELIRKAAELEDPLKRQMTISAIIATELENKGTKVMLVGGSAVEFYTAASYLTRDIDFVATHPDHIKETMVNLGFKNNGGTWHLPNSSILVEFPTGPLDGDWDKAQIVTIPGDMAVKVIGIEDIIIDRSNAATHWQDHSEEWVLNMITSQYDSIDWQYLIKRAEEEQCLEVITTAKKEALHQRTLFEIEIQKQQRIDEITGIRPMEESNKSIYREYIAQAKSLLDQNGLWLDSFDTTIAQNMKRKGYSSLKIKDAISNLSPEVIGMKQDKRLEYLKKIVPIQSRGISR